MQQVISREKEPITPFLERAGDLYEKAGVSTILVAGSSGAFFYIADHIIQMDCYKPVEITERVKALCKEHQAPETQAPGFAVPSFAKVYAAGKSENAKVKTFGRDSFSIDRETVDLRYVEQLADFEQTSALCIRKSLPVTLWSSWPTAGKICARLWRNCKSGSRQRDGTA